MKIKKNFLLFFTSLFSFFAFSDCADCQAYKTQVANDCDSIISSCDTAYFDCVTAAGAAETFAVYYASNSTERAHLTQAAESARSASGTLTALKTFAQSIKSTALALQCSTNTAVSCDCASVLQSIVSQLSTINNSVVANGLTLSTIASRFESVDGSLESVVDWLDDFREAWDSVTDDFYTNELDICDILAKFFLYDYASDTVPYNISDIMQFYSLFTNSLFQTFMSSSGVSRFPHEAPTPFKSKVTFTPFRSNYRFYSSTQFSLTDYGLESAGFYNLLYNFAYKWPELMVSHYNVSLSNLFTTATSYQTVKSISQDVSSLTNQFSIFVRGSLAATPVLSSYTAQDGSYHEYLTNYYIQVSGSSVSGSTPLTNWFNRIELLLASLVFQDDGTNFVDDSANTSQFENTLSQSVDTLSQAVSLPQNVTGKIDNMGHSFLGLLGEWRTIVSGNSLPSHFVLCDINLSSSQNRDSPPIDSFRLETSLDSGEFRQFLDFCHAITTILFTMLFVWFSIFLLSFLLSSLSRLAYFCYTVYSALFGG